MIFAGATSDHIFWVSILVTHAALQLWELLLQYLQMVEVGASLLILSCRHSTNRSHPGKANGSCGSTQLFVHAIDNGAWTSKDSLSALFSLVQLIDDFIRNIL